MFHKFRVLEVENQRLRRENAELRQKLTETSHWLTYISEQSNHRDVEQEYPGDGPAPGMFK